MSCSLLTVLLTSLSLIAQETPAGKSEPGTSPIGKVQHAERVDLRALFDHAYSELTAANERDFRRHRQLSQRYRETGNKLNEQAGSRPKAEEALAVALIYEQMAECNRAILDGIRAGTTGEPVRQAMADLMKLERRLSELRQGELTRDWLTFQEVGILRKRGRSFRSGEPGVLPFKRHHWQGISR